LLFESRTRVGLSCEHHFIGSGFRHIAIAEKALQEEGCEASRSVGAAADDARTSHQPQTGVETARASMDANKVTKKMGLFID
jgi:hypothetical protein